MINLLPPAEKKLICKEYMLRLSIISLSFFIFSIAVGSASLLPAFFLSEAKEREAVKNLAVLEQSAVFEKRGDAEETVRSVSKKIAVFADSKTEQSTPLLFRAVSDARTSGVSVIGFLYQKTVESKDIVRAVVLQGVSETREGLVSYADSLKRTGLFLSVDVPTESLTRSANIPFIMSLILKK